MGFTQEAIRSSPRLVKGDQNRAWEIWDKPPPALPGVIVAFSIYFPASEFVLAKEQRPKNAWTNVRVVSSAAVGFTTVVSLCITAAGMGVEHSNTSSELGAFDLADGKCARLIAHEVVDTDIARKVQEIREIITNAVRANGGEAPPDTFGYFLAHRPDGARNLIGVRLPVGSDA
ncbi:hypothetical protein [Bradyrhizobium sp. LMTR 3]|uniref:hypothetical protein n=1 Tax=Bradyrhizobium sp. LMTR 3 TaxID=189873 RepID=UPI000810DFDF|nr:hypothetical protein [Bradyrhizobium sp. LMTR 3]OCK59852.1 hypothetical protein LMTR3_19725 [Bradyrhizobium sp. LMTR 3]